jgi:hypothetical protein
VEACEVEESGDGAEGFLTAAHKPKIIARQPDVPFRASTAAVVFED